MKLIFRKNTSPRLTGCALTFGNFDGVHLGHQALLRRLKHEADARGLPMVVVLFEPQPEEFFKHAEAASRITSLRDKVRYLMACGVDELYCIHFTQTIAQLSAQDFIQQMLFSALKADYILLGEDARFGYAREGSLALLQQMASPFHKTVEPFLNHLRAGVRVSSTAVRACLKDGDLAEAATLLGRSYQVSGRVGYGLGRGRQMGIPTANLCVRYRKPALLGVYAVDVTKQDGQRFQGVANWGSRPTFGEERAFYLEVHGLNWDENLYGQHLQVTFLKKIRAEMRFDSMQRLMLQIHQDIDEACAFFACADGIYGVTQHE
ncbi:MAG: bifunctional riboflavin kinase/FAD synthetase [Gammaproteobacteria bacterium]|nr:bifunctional riboflavin kinase/FAD synthetase [Gammaproteobacteria bacterium]